MSTLSLLAVGTYVSFLLLLLLFLINFLNHFQFNKCPRFISRDKQVAGIYPTLITLYMTISACTLLTFLHSPSPPSPRTLFSYSSCYRSFSLHTHSLLDINLVALDTATNSNSLHFTHMALVCLLCMLYILETYFSLSRYYNMFAFTNEHNELRLPFTLYLILFLLLFWLSISVLPIVALFACALHITVNLTFSYRFHHSIKLSFDHLLNDSSNDFPQHFHNNVYDDMHEQLKQIRIIAILSSTASVISAFSWYNVLLCGHSHILPFSLSLNNLIFFSVFTKNRLFVKHLFTCQCQLLCYAVKSPCLLLIHHRAKKNYIQKRQKSIFDRLQKMSRPSFMNVLPSLNTHKDGKKKKAKPPAVPAHTLNNSLNALDLDLFGLEEEEIIDEAEIVHNLPITLEEDIDPDNAIFVNTKVELKQQHSTESEIQLPAPTRTRTREDDEFPEHMPQIVASCSSIVSGEHMLEHGANGNSGDGEENLNHFNTQRLSQVSEKSDSVDLFTKMRSIGQTFRDMQLKKNDQLNLIKELELQIESKTDYVLSENREKNGQKQQQQNVRQKQQKRAHSPPAQRRHVQRKRVQVRTPDGRHKNLVVNINVDDANNNNNNRRPKHKKKNISFGKDMAFLLIEESMKKEEELVVVDRDDGGDDDDDVAEMQRSVNRLRLNDHASEPALRSSFDYMHFKRLMVDPANASASGMDMNCKPAVSVCSSGSRSTSELIPSGVDRSQLRHAAETAKLSLASKTVPNSPQIDDLDYQDIKYRVAAAKDDDVSGGDNTVNNIKTQSDPIGENKSFKFAKTNDSSDRIALFEYDRGGLGGAIKMQLLRTHSLPLSVAKTNGFSGTHTKKPNNQDKNAAYVISQDTMDADDDDDEEDDGFYMYDADYFYNTTHRAVAREEPDMKTPLTDSLSPSGGNRAHDFGEADPENVGDVAAKKQSMTIKVDEVRELQARDAQRHTPENGATAAARTSTNSGTGSGTGTGTGGNRSVLGSFRSMLSPMTHGVSHNSSVSKSVDSTSKLRKINSFLQLNGMSTMRHANVNAYFHDMQLEMMAAAAAAGNASPTPRSRQPQQYATTLTPTTAAAVMARNHNAVLTMDVIHE